MKPTKRKPKDGKATGKKKAKGKQSIFSAQPHPSPEAPPSGILNRFDFGWVVTQNLGEKQR
jgi:hypothetical protein